MKNFKCIVSYDGSQYYGWQKQKNEITVQGIIEYALREFFNEKIIIHGASRTDAGVHAMGQVFNFKISTQLKSENIKSILNDLLPSSIKIKNVEEVPHDFNARHNVKSKLYRYVVFNSKEMPPFFNNYVWHITNRIDILKIKEVLPLFKGIKNYFSFSKSGSSFKNPIREIKSIKISRNNKFIYFDFKGKSFLYQMIRKITAVLVSYSLGEIDKDIIQKMFEKEDRAIFRGVAPPNGLYLVKIIYEKR